jgi:hypothetical protein
MTEQSTSAPGNTKPCRYCASPIPQEASLCSVCKSDQHPWKTRSVFLSGIAGFLALVASAATYVTTSLRSIYAQQYAPERLELHDFEVDFGNVYAGAISNPNDQEVYIASVFIAWNKGTRFLRVGKTIRPHTFLRFEGDRFDVNQITSAGILAFPKNISGRPFSLDKIYKATNLAVSVKSPDPAKFDEELPCIWPQFYSHEDTAFQMYQDFNNKFGSELITDRAQARLEFWTPRSPEKKFTEIELVVAFLVQHQTKPCKSFSTESLKE